MINYLFASQGNSKKFSCGSHGRVSMNWRIVTGIWGAGSILLSLFLSYGAGFRDIVSMGVISIGSVISVGLATLYFVLAIAIWDSEKTINKFIVLIAGAFIPILLILGIRWTLGKINGESIFHMRRLMH